MNQDIITLTIVLAATAYTLYLLTKQVVSLFYGKRKTHACSGCTECELHPLSS